VSLEGIGLLAVSNTTNSSNNNSGGEKVCLSKFSLHKSVLF